MKLRIHDDSIRLRLTQTEVDAISQGQEVRHCLNFGGSMPVFLYTLQASAAVERMKAEYQNNEIRILIPEKQAVQWASSDQVGIEEILLNSGGQLHILVEKDFQCLHKRPHEDETDNFPNPAAEPSH